ncbi:MAG TPA: hypothetical protein VFS31_05945, partial [Chitinophagaceae bacterium]|nr:hypothetical protein [Chitinophagaceae bacterium]
MPPVLAQNTRYLPKIIPQAPNTSSLLRFGVYEVNLFTGVPDISIPLYEIQAGDLKVPITLSYHASGIKVTDNASWVGLGWALSAGGMISRKVMAGPDEFQGNYLSGTHIIKASDIDPHTQAGLDVLNLIRNGSYDMEPDIFTYSMPGYDGKFFFNQRDSYKPVLMPYQPVVINKTLTSGQLKFDLLDEKGVQYKFGYTAAESCLSSSGSNSSSATTAWMLEQMRSANGGDVINFTYNAVSGQTAADDVDYIIVNDNVINYTSQSGYSYDQGMSYNSTYTANTTEQQLNEITFPNGKVVFNLATADRLDGFFPQKALDGITVYGYNNATGQYEVLKKVKFYQSYFYNDNTYRLRLDSLAMLDKTGAVAERYVFEYDNTVQLPKKKSKSRDYWGYYNGKFNTTLVPHMEIPFTAGAATGTTTISIGESFAGGRDPDFQYMKANILKKIIYPTGGYTTFEFEVNKYIDDQDNVKYAGGLRISKISSTDGIRGTPTVTTYKYGDNDCGRANFILENNFFQTTRTARLYKHQTGVPCVVLISQKRVRTFVANPALDIEPYDAAAVVYPKVTVFTGDAYNNAGKIEYQFRDRSDALTSASFVGRPILTNYSFDRGQVSSKKVFKRDAAGSYIPVTETAYYYSAFPEKFYDYVALVVDKTLTTDVDGASDVPLGPDDLANGCSAINDSQNFFYADYSIRSDDNYVTQEVVTNYDQLDPGKTTTVTTNYFYDNFAHQQVTRKQVTDSKNNTLLTTYKYPHEMVQAGVTDPYSTMISRNMIAEKVKETTVQNGTVTLSQASTNYKLWPNNIIEPESVQTSNFSNPLETAVSFNSYDATDNILQYIPNTGGATAVIWDYNNHLVIAKAENAGIGEIAYTSFEAEGKGNWTFAGTGSADATTITGKYCYSLGGGALSKAGLNSTKQYIVSFWYKTGAVVNVTGGTQVSTGSGSTVDGWTYKEITVSNTSAV